MLIDCDTCELRDLACDDCVVTVLLGPTRLSAGTPSYAGVVTLTTPDAGSEHRDLVELDEGERAALAVLADSGLVPPLRLVVPGAPGPSGTSGERRPSSEEHAV